MILDTLAQPTPALAPRPGAQGATRALVLMGGGARTAYQVGVLRGLAAQLRLRSAAATQRFPFQLLVGTSSGALHGACLAGRAASDFAPTVLSVQPGISS